MRKVFLSGALAGATARPRGGPPRWLVQLAGYADTNDTFNSTSVEQLGTDSDCDSGTPSYYAWYEMYPNHP